MAFDATIADRVRPLMVRRAGCAEKKMFGAVGFLLHGNMCVGVWKEFLIVRVGPEAYAEALNQRGVQEFDQAGHGADAGHAVGESADARQNDTVGPADGFRIVCDGDGGADASFSRGTFEGLRG